MKKILLAISPSKAFGGGQKVFLTTISELLKKKYEVVVVLPDESLLDNFKTLDVTIYLVNFNSISCINSIRKILRKEKVDIINTYLPRCSFAFSFVNLFFRVPICCTLLNAAKHQKLNILQSSVYPMLYFLLFKISDGFIVNSEENKKHFIKVAKINEDFIKVIYSGIDMDEFSNNPYQKEKTNSFFVGMVGRLSKEKGPSYLVEALSFMKGIDFKCLIVGDGPLKNELEDQVKKNICKKDVSSWDFRITLLNSCRRWM